MIDGPILARLTVEPGRPAGLPDRDPSDRLGLQDKSEARIQLAELVERMALLQNRLWAESRRAILLVLQGMDAAGKDGTIRRVFTGVNPQGCDVSSFKEPTPREEAHDYLWRVHARCPLHGEIGIFNRSHYEDVVAAPLLGVIDDARRDVRFRHIRHFEGLLHDEGTQVLKVFLHISREEQKRRLQERLSDPEKRWKFSEADLVARRSWDDYQAAYDLAIGQTSTRHAPWYVVPADRKWVRDVAVATLLVRTLEHMDPHPPASSADLDDLVVR